VKDVEVVVLSIPFAKYPALASLFSNVPAEVVVIDTSNYYPFCEGAITEVDTGKSESVWVSEEIGRPIIKAWDAMLSHTFSNRKTPEGTPGRIAIPGAGDDAKAKTTAMQLVEKPQASTHWMRVHSPSPGGSSLARRPTALNLRG
jgi:predicted dinucleotide-binding enzyme